MFENMLFKILFTLLACSSYILHKIIYVYHLIDFLNIFPTVMQKAWRERNPPARIKAAYQALELNNE